MRRGFRKWFFIITAVWLSVLAFQAVKGLNPFGKYNGLYGLTLNKTAVSERKAVNIVSTVAFDYRAIDTLCEEFMLFAAVAGVSLLLRRKAEEVKEVPDEDLPGREAPDTSDALKVFGLMMTGFLFLFGLYIVLHANLTPGGGFQGGVVLASAILLIYLSSGYEQFSHIVSFKKLEIIEAAGLAGFLLIGLFPVFQNNNYLYNFIPYGKQGEYLSGGTILVLNFFVGMAVAGGIILLVNEFLEQTILLREKRAVYRRKKGK